jgi:hypothetical protein
LLSSSVSCPWLTAALDIPSSLFEDYTTLPPDGLGNLFEGPSLLEGDVSLRPERDYTAGGYTWQLGNPFLGPTIPDVSQNIEYAAVDHDEDSVLDEFLNFPNEPSPMNTSSSESHCSGNDGASASSWSKPMFTSISPEYSERQDDVTLSIPSAPPTPLPCCAKLPLRHSSMSTPRTLPISRALSVRPCSIRNGRLSEYDFCSAIRRSQRSFHHYQYAIVPWH